MKAAAYDATGRATDQATYEAIYDAARHCYLSWRSHRTVYTTVHHKIENILDAAYHATNEVFR